MILGPNVRVCVYSSNVNVSAVYNFMVTSANNFTREQFSNIHSIVNKGIQESHVNDQQYKKHCGSSKEFEKPRR